MISCILLAAGLSSRFGSSKALAQVNGQTVIEYLQNKLVDSKINEIIIVLGAHAEEIKPHLFNHKKVKSVYNKNYNLGQTSSFKAGLSVVSENIRGILLLPVDYPAIKTSTLDFLIKEFNERQYPILIPTFNGIKGHPPIFSVEFKNEIINLDNSLGINTVANENVFGTLLVPVNDQGIVLTFNTKDDFQKIKQYLD